MILSLGAKNDDVKTLQSALAALGFSVGVIDGDFGPKTETAVRMFQASRALVVDGIVGPKTWTAVLRPDTTAVRAPFPAERCWPLRCLPDGRKPQITSRHSSRNPSRSNHHGVDVLYAWKLTDPPKKIGDSGRTARWAIPEDTFCIAPFAGEVVIAGNSPTGMRVWLRNDSGWNSGFFHMDYLSVRAGQVLDLGAPIGRVNDSPRGDDPDHLHFELYWGDIVDDVRRGLYPRGTTDPELMLGTTPYLPAV